MNGLNQVAASRGFAARRLAPAVVFALAAITSVVPVHAGLRVATAAPAAVPAEPSEFTMVAPPPMPLVAGDETIGSLPILTPPPLFDVVDYFHEANASFYVQGQRFDVLNAIVESLGAGVATIDVLDAASDTVRVVFHGRALLKLDRAYVDLGIVEIGLATPFDFGSGVIHAKFNQRELPAQELGAGASAFSPALLAATHAYQGRRLYVAASGPNSGVTSLTMRSSRHFLSVDQMLH